MVHITQDMQQRLDELLHAFLAENAKLNLSALRTEDAARHGNVNDSLPFLDLIEQDIIPAPRSLIDVGTGGGFPLLPLALTLPMTMCVGVDSIGKKIDAVRRIATACNLHNVQLIADRAEKIGHNPLYRERFDAVVSRAVAPLNILLEYCVPLATQDGVIVLWKSMHVDSELTESERAQKALQCELIHTHRYNLDEQRPANHSSGRSDGWGVRQLLVFRKNATTPPMYPREVGAAKKEPL